VIGRFSSSSILFIALVLGIVGAAKGQTNIDKETNAPVVAIINGDRIITRAEIDELIGAQVFSLEERLYNLRKNALDNLITRIVLEQEAETRGITVEQLKKQLMPEKVDINQSQVEEVYSDNMGGLGNMPEDEAKQRIKLDLESRERLERYKTVLAALKAKAKIAVSLPEPVPPTLKISEEGPAIGGPKNAAVTIIEFSDFQCPYCKQASHTVKQVLKSYGDKVRLIFKHLPLPIHPEAFKAAQASVCAGEQGKFWEYHDGLFGTDKLSGEALTKLAADLGLSMKEFSACVDSETSRAVVARDIRESRKADIQATPTFIINGKLMKGARGPEDFKKMIDEELERNQKYQKPKAH
jgi:protein-disulfide isomerase